VLFCLANLVLFLIQWLFIDTVAAIVWLFDEIYGRHFLVWLGGWVAGMP
jgi:hypothetical protein